MNSVYGKMNFIHHLYVISPTANDLRGKRPFSINTRTVVAFREIGQGYEGLQKFGTLVTCQGHCQNHHIMI